MKQTVAHFEMLNCPHDIVELRRVFESVDLPVTIRPGTRQGLCHVTLHDTDAVLIENDDRSICLYRFSSRPVYLLFGLFRDGWVLQALVSPVWPDDDDLIRLVRHMDKCGPKWAAKQTRQVVGEIIFTRIRRDRANSYLSDVATSVARALEDAVEGQTASPETALSPENKPN